MRRWLLKLLGIGQRRIWEVHLETDGDTYVVGRVRARSVEDATAKADTITHDAIWRACIATGTFAPCRWWLVEVAGR